MTLEEYVSELHREVEAFAEYWRKSSQETPEHFPEELDIGDWDEQFRTWID